MGSIKHRKKREYRMARCRDCGQVFKVMSMCGDSCQSCHSKLTPEQTRARTICTYSLNGKLVSKEEFERATK